MDARLFRHLVYEELLAAARPATYAEAQTIIANNCLADARNPRSVRLALQKFLLLKVADEPDELAEHVYKRFSDAICEVPGFYINGGRPRLNCSKNSALNRYFWADGLIAGCFVYSLKRGGEYLLSSYRFGGPAAANPRRNSLLFL